MDLFSFLAPAPEADDANEQDAEEDRPVTGAALGQSIWGIANAVTSVVQQTAEEIVKTVQDTDWKSEIAEFSREVQVDAVTVGSVTASAVQHLPEQVHELLESDAGQGRAAHDAKPPARAAVDDAPGSDTSALPVVPEQVAATMSLVGSSLTAWGHSLVRGAREVLDEVKEVIEEEVNELQVRNQAHLRARARTERRLANAAGKYSRFDAEVAAMQRDSATYIDPPEDEADFEAWTSSFDLAGKEAEIERIIGGNAFMAELQNRLVPLLVERTDFWTRYFYRLHKLQQKEDARQQLTQRTALMEQEDAPGWGWDDHGEEGGEEGAAGAGAAGTRAKGAAAGGDEGGAPAEAAAADGDAGVAQPPQASPQGEAAPVAQERSVSKAAARAAAPAAQPDAASAASNAAAAVAAAGVAAGVTALPADAESADSAGVEAGPFPAEAAPSAGAVATEPSSPPSSSAPAAEAASPVQPQSSSAHPAAKDGCASPAATAVAPGPPTTAAQAGGEPRPRGEASDDSNAHSTEVVSTGSTDQWSVVGDGQDAQAYPPRPAATDAPAGAAGAAAAAAATPAAQLTESAPGAAAAQGDAVPADAAGADAAPPPPSGEQQPATPATASEDPAASEEPLPAADDEFGDDDDDFGADAGGGGGGGDEEVDEDWGTWD